MPGTETRFADLNDVRLAYTVTGRERVPLVLVHGSWGSHHNWDAVVGGLSEHFQVVTYDRRGHSQSSAPPGQGSCDDQVADLAAAIEHLRLEPTWVAGNSSGAVITLKLAAAQPKLLRGIIVHEPPLVGHLAPGSAEAEAWSALENGPMAEVGRCIERGDYAGAAQRFVDDVALGPGAWVGLPEPMRAMMTHNAPTFLDEMRDPSWGTVDERALADFDGPALLTGGGASPAFYRPVLDRMERVLPRAERLTYPGAGHIPHVTHPNEYIATLVAFMVHPGRLPEAAGR